MRHVSHSLMPSVQCGSTFDVCIQAMEEASNQYRLSSKIAFSDTMLVYNDFKRDWVKDTSAPFCANARVDMNRVLTCGMCSTLLSVIGVPRLVVKTTEPTPTWSIVDLSSSSHCHLHGVCLEIRPDVVRCGVLHHCPSSNTLTQQRTRQHQCLSLTPQWRRT
jgi:hypothetical protein